MQTNNNSSFKDVLLPLIKCSFIYLFVYISRHSTICCSIYNYAFISEDTLRNRDVRLNFLMGRFLAWYSRLLCDISLFFCQWNFGGAYQADNANSASFWSWRTSEFSLNVMDYFVTSKIKIHQDEDRFTKNEQINGTSPHDYKLANFGMPASPKMGS